MLICIDPQRLEEGQLQAYAIDETMADSEVAQHVQACAACQAEVATMRRLAARLGQQLSRYDCLSTEILLDLAARFLPRTERRAAEAHVAHCARCSEELALTVEAFAQPEPLLSWTSPTTVQTMAAGVRRVIASLVDALAPNNPDVALGVNLRGHATDASANPHLFAAEEVMLSIRGLVGANRAVFVDGLLSSTTDAALPTAEIPVRLYLHTSADAAPTLVAEDTADGGIFSLGPIPAGHYTLEVELPDRIIAIESIDF